MSMVYNEHAYIAGISTVSYFEVQYVQFLCVKLQNKYCKVQMLLANIIPKILRVKFCGFLNDHKKF